MKRNWKNRFTLLLLLPLMLLMACKPGVDHASHDTYTCPMHPTVVSDAPGTCPVCGMDLVRKARPGEEVEITKELSDAITAPNKSVMSAVKTIKPEYKSVAASVKAVGVVTYDTRNLYTIPARVGGRIEKMYVKYEFQPVRKGQKIADIYSPEMITAQRELLYLIEHDPENTTLLEGARSKLIRMGFSASHVQDLIRKKETENTFSVYSPYDGYALTGNSSPPVSNFKNNMNSMESPAASSDPLSKQPIDLAMREGVYVSSGQALLRVVNTNALRIELDLSQQETGQVKEGDKIEINLGNGRKDEAVVNFVQPFFNEGQSFLKIRVNVNDLDLHIGQLVTTSMEFNTRESLWIPKQAVVDLGIDKVVFIKGRGTFKPTKVTTGISSGEWLEVKSGLATSDEIAADAHYLVDSESFIKTVN